MIKPELLESIHYVNEAGVKFAHRQVIDVAAEMRAHEPWFNETLTTVNDAVVRLGIFHGDYPFHKHTDQDEFFLVLEGEIFMDVEGQEPALLKQFQGYTVPKGVVHRPRSPQRSAVLMVESVGIEPTGD
ncbi:MAG TPA: cupin domain-containing protein [Candidatus Eremiobacteraceae bacterium]|jgi:mannose-6-phosphate isomerase-like protein (cupin superfamily)